MKTILRISTTFLVLAVIFMAFRLIRTDERDKVILTVIRQSLEAAHYENIKIDDRSNQK